MMLNNKNSIIDQIMRNAHVLGKLATTVNKLSDKPYLINEYNEVSLRRYHIISIEQTELINQLKEKI